jgi:hypothetical protein
VKARILSASALIVAMATPASAQWAVIDVNAIARLGQQIAQTEQLVASARANLAALPGSFNISNAQQRIAGVNSIIASARQACSSAQQGNVAPAVCRVKVDVMSAQAATLGQQLATIAGNANAARGSTGALQISQAQAASLSEIATSLGEEKQRAIAASQQEEYETALKARVLGHGNVHN